MGQVLKTMAIVAGLLAGGSAAVDAASPEVVKALAPDGRLRAAINFGNPVLAQKGSDGQPAGVSAALARALGQALQVPVTFVPYAEAGQVSGAARSDAWDVAFLAVDPVRAADIDFTAPYVVIEGTYLVPAASPLRDIAGVDAYGVRIGVAKGSAYDLFLTRTLKHAHIERASDSEAAFELLHQGKVEALAGVKQPLVRYAATHADVRVIPGRFMEIEQAMALPKGRDAALPFLRGFVETMKASGFVARELVASGQADATVAPPAP